MHEEPSRFTDRRLCQLYTVQDFLIKLGINHVCIYIWEMSILSENNVIVRPTKIMNRADKNRETKVFKKFHYQKSARLIFFTEKKIKKILLIFDAEK